MDYEQEAQRLAMMLHNAQISEYHYCQELAALKYEHGDRMNHADDRHEVAA